MVVGMKRATFIASLAVVLAAFAALVCAPAEALAGAKRGLEVCAGVIVPALSPFLIVSALLTGLGLPQLLAKAAGPFFARLFGVSGAAAAPFLLGLTGGYPVGAAAAAELCRRGELGGEEGTYILPFCNNTGPAFILGATGVGIFGSGRAGVLLYLSHILAAVAVGVLLSLGRPRGTARAAAAKMPIEARSLATVLPQSVKSAALSTLNICGYVVFFSVITGLLDALGVFTASAAALAAHLGLELQFTRALLTGLLELGSGVSAMRGLSLTPLNLALASFVLGFGGLSVHCQTLAAVDGTEIKTARHFAGRLLHGALSALFTFLAASALTAGGML